MTSRVTLRCQRHLVILLARTDGEAVSDDLALDSGLRTPRKRYRTDVHNAFDSGLGAPRKDTAPVSGGHPFRTH